MKTRNFAWLLVVSVSLAGSASSQVNHTEVEPNGTKPEATLVAGFSPLDTLSGMTTGTGAAAGDMSSTTVDTFRIRMTAMPLQIWQHTLRLTSSGPVGQHAQILCVYQQNGVPQPGTDAAFQYSATSSAVPNSNVWYGFGRQEEIYYRVTGLASTTGTYTATLTSTPVTPTVIPTTFDAGPVVISTWQQGHFTNTEIYLYDSSFDPVPLGHNDESFASPLSAILTMQNLAAGTYYVAVSTANTANDQSDLIPGEYLTNGGLLDFPNVVVNGAGGNNPPVTFVVNDGTHAFQQVATQPHDYYIYWARIHVGTPPTPTTGYCFGDGSATACPCGNFGTAGNGCASSVSAAGGHLGAAGVASVTSDTFVLSGSGMPNSSALYFQGTTQTAGGAGFVFGDGLRCASGTIRRLGTKTNFGGSSSYPAAGDVAISINGVNSAGAVRTYQVWYRNAAAFCSPSTFNLTNGVQVTWGP